MINACDSLYDLPLYPRLNSDSCHDSVSFVISWTEFSQRFNLGTVDKILLDDAHNAEAIYRLINHKNVEPIIDLNKRMKKNTKTKNDIQISPGGVPICPIGKKMRPNSYDHTQNRQKWRCPFVYGLKNTCETPLLPNTVEPTIRIIKIICVYFLKHHQGKRINGKRSTNADHPSNV